MSVPRIERRLSNASLRRPSRVGASPSPGRPASSAPRWSERLCVRSPTARSSCWCAQAVAPRPRQRVQREILRNDAFDNLRSILGTTFDEEMARRITVIAGDVSSDGLGLDDAGREALGACDIVIHSAATVSFDSATRRRCRGQPAGPVRIVQTLQSLGVHPHLVSVSTCYVAGNRRGAAPEKLVSDARSTWGSTGGARLPRPDGPQPTPTPRAPIPSDSRTSAPEHAQSSEPRARPLRRRRPSSCDSAGCPIS